jgi:acyl carrier protein
LSTDFTVFAEIETIIRSAAADLGDELTITPASTFNDLGMRSLDIAVLAARIRAHFGWAINFSEFVACSDATTVMDISIQGLVDYIDDLLKDSFWS